MINWRNTRLPKLEDESKVNSLFEMAQNWTYELGFQYCSFTLSSQLTNDQTKAFRINNYPNEWNKLYQQGHFVDVDPIVEHCKRSVLPIVWEKQVFGAAPSLWELAQSYGVHNGWSQAVHGFQGVYSTLTLGRGEGEVTPQELYESAGQVLWLCHALHAAVMFEYANRPSIKPPSRLTPRETEILKWSAMGKTASDIAIILNISERTIGFHISSCFKKLGVNNKIGAVLAASKMGCLD